jgi:dTDP-4-amino-4,6-dideoxygalactose transaminase
VSVPGVGAALTFVWAQYTLRTSGRFARRDRMMKTMATHGIPINLYHPRPLRGQLAYAHYPVSGNGTPVASRMPGEVLTLPMHPYMAAAEQDRIVAALS